MLDINVGYIYTWMSLYPPVSSNGVLDTEKADVWGGSELLPRAARGKRTPLAMDEAFDEKWWFTQLKYGYGSIPIDTIFSGMNIHLPAILGVHQGYKVLTHCQILIGSHIWYFVGHYSP